MTSQSGGQTTDVESVSAGALAEASLASAKSPMGAGQIAAKRAMDIILTLLSFIIVVPVGVVIAICIKLDSKGPVFYTQNRVGKEGKLFKLYKFRSMVKGANELKAQLENQNEGTGPIFKIKKDPRVTRVGKLLRKSSLDELPQLINILMGEMSIVGPRPPLPEEVELYTDYQRGRLAVKPGLTCIWQISGRSSLTFDKWVALDLEYIRHQSVWLDIKIILQTIPAVLKGTGAW